jgi:hypothetical protein
MFRLLCAVVVISVVSLCGCASPRGRLHGTVRHQGKPLTGATIIFLASDNQTYPVRLAPDGTYQVASLPQGHIRVSIQVDEPRIPPRAAPAPGKAEDTLAAAREKDDDAAKQGRKPSATATEAPNLLARYTDPNQSGLEFDLTGADQDYSPDLD